MAAWASWYIDRQHDPYNPNEFHLFLVSDIIMELGYPGLVPGNEDQNLAIALTERISIKYFDAKEIVLADLKYAPTGASPDPEAYDRALARTALALLHHSADTFFPRLNYRDADLGELTQDDLFLQGPADFWRQDTPWVPKDLGYQSLLDIGSAALARIPALLESLEGKTACFYLQQALSYVKGTPTLTNDTDYAEIWIRLVPKEFFLRLAAKTYHSEASYLYSEQTKTQGEFVDVAFGFKVAELGGIPEAGIALRQLEEATGKKMSASDVDRASAALLSYQAMSCFK